MRASDAFIVASLAHLARGEDGPAPGVPARVSREFETSLVATCAAQGISPAILRSLDRLALPPSMSSVSMVRLRKMAEETREDARRRIDLAVRISGEFTGAGVPHAAVGDVRSALTLYENPVRAVDSVDFLVGEARLGTALQVLDRLGFVSRFHHPRWLVEDSVGGATEDPLVAVRAFEPTVYHHCFAPLALMNSHGDVVRVRTRVADIGYPNRNEPALERIARLAIDTETNIPVVDLEDHLLQRALALAASRFSRLGLAMDVGRIVARHAEVDWDEIDLRSRRRGFAAALVCTMEHACKMVNTPPPSERWHRPPVLRRSWFNTMWIQDEPDYQTRRPASRFRFGVLERDGWRRRFRFVAASAAVRHRWVEGIYGRGLNPSTWLRFMLLARRPAPLPPHSAGAQAAADHQWPVD